MTTDWIILGCIALGFLIATWLDRRAENREISRKRRRLYCGHL